jgi:hypothetical protein
VRRADHSLQAGCARGDSLTSCLPLFPTPPLCLAATCGRDVQGEEKNKATHTWSCFKLSWLFEHFQLTSSEAQLAYIERARATPPAIRALRLRDDA